MADERMREYVREVRLKGALIFHFCGWEKCAPGHTFGPAVRPHFLFHFILSGKGFFEKEGKRWELQAGEGFLIFPGESTRYGARKTDPWEYCWIGFAGDEAREILEECGLTQSSPIYEDHSRGLLQEELLRLIDSFGDLGENRYTLLGRLYLCFSHMAQKGRKKGEAGESYVNKALNFIHRNFSYEISVEQVARAVGIDRTYLYRLFRQQTGKSPKEYLTELRLKSAAGMLRKTKLSVTEVAFSCGYKEASLFARHFKSLYGISPLAYRKSGELPERLCDLSENT